MLIDLDGRVSRAVLASKTMDDSAKMIEWGHSGEWFGTQKPSTAKKSDTQSSLQCNVIKVRLVRSLPENLI